MNKKWKIHSSTYDTSSRTLIFTTGTWAMLLQSHPPLLHRSSNIEWQYLIMSFPNDEGISGSDSTRGASNRLKLWRLQRFARLEGRQRRDFTLHIHKLCSVSLFCISHCSGKAVMAESSHIDSFLAKRMLLSGSTLSREWSSISNVSRFSEFSFTSSLMV